MLNSISRLPKSSRVALAYGGGAYLVYKAFKNDGNILWVAPGGYLIFMGYLAQQL